MFFWNSRFFDDPADVGNLISGSCAFSKYDTFLKSKHEMKSILYTCGVLDIWPIYYWFNAYYAQASLIAQSIKNLTQCRRPRFDFWVRKIPWRRKWQPTPYSCLENPMDRGAWQAIVHEVIRVRRDLASKPPPPSCPGSVFVVQDLFESQMELVISNL